MSQENKALSRRFFEAFNAGDWDTITGLVSDEYVSHDPAQPEEVRGPEALRAQLEQYRVAFPDLTFTIEQQLAEGEYVVTRWRATGTHRGELFGIPATSRQGNVTGVSIDRIQNGRFVETYGNWDTLGLLQQLGVIPAPAPAAA